MDKKAQNKLFNKKLISLVLPIAFQQFMLSLVSASDAFMLGGVSQNSLSAVSLAGQVQFVFNLFLGGMSLGTSIFAAQYWGKGDTKTIEKLLGFVLKITAIVGLMFSLSAILIPNQIMLIFTAEQTIIDEGVLYLRAVSSSYLLCAISQIYICIMKNTGRAVESTVASSVTVVLNIMLNAILIFGLLGLPKLGVVGAAVATVIARAVELIWVLVSSFFKNRVRLKFRYFAHTDKQLRRDFWKYTMPVLLNQFAWGIGFTMYSVIMGHLGTDAVAANSIATIAKNMVICFCMGVGNGGSIIVGNELGAGNMKTAKEYGGRVCRLSIISGLASGIVLALLSPLIVSVMDLSETASNYLFWMMILLVINITGKSINCVTIAGIFCAGGDSRFGLICDTVNMWCVIIPIGLLSAFVWKLPVIAVFFILNLDEVTKLPIVYRHYKKYNWLKDLTKQNNSISE